MPSSCFPTLGQLTTLARSSQPQPTAFSRSCFWIIVPKGITQKICRPKGNTESSARCVWQSRTTSRPLLEASGQGSHSIPGKPSAGIHLFLAQHYPLLGWLIPLSNLCPQALILSRSCPRSECPTWLMMNSAQCGSAFWTEGLT